MTLTINDERKGLRIGQVVLQTREIRPALLQSHLPPNVPVENGPVDRD